MRHKRPSTSSNLKPGKVFKSGTVAIVGAPNVGKSTLFNALLSQKIAAVSSRPQTTRQRIVGIISRPQAQLVLIDCPGFHRPGQALGHWMLKQLEQALSDADLVLMLIPAGWRFGPLEAALLQKIHDADNRLVIAINKVDTLPKEQLLPQLQDLHDRCGQAAFALSAKTGEGLPQFLKALVARLPGEKALYPGEYPTIHSVRELAAEFIREKAMEKMRQEIPYGLAVLIEAFREPQENRRSTEIHATLIVEKAGHKPILVGKGGAMIREIGTEARKDIEKLLGGPVNLQLFVKVVPGWTKDPHRRKEFGYG